MRDYNQRVKPFPSVIVANMFNFEEEEFFEVEESVREGGAPQVDFGRRRTAPVAAPPLRHRRSALGRTVGDERPRGPAPPADDVPEPPDQPTPPNPTG